MTPLRFNAIGNARKSLRCLILVGVALVMGMPGRAAAAVIAVNSFADNSDVDGLCTLREAITSANNDVSADDCEAGGVFGADLIVFDAPGPTTITLTSALPDITDDETLTIDGATLITISGNDAVQVFTVGTGASLALENLTVRDGFATGGSPSGGGIVNAGGTLTVTNCTLIGNHADSDGGGIWSSGTVTITNSTLADNSATVNGGGIENNAGTVEVIGSTLSGNSALADGGAIININGGSFTITNSTLSGNTATVRGGGIINVATLTLTHATLAGNSAPAGGGIFNIGEGTLTITNSLVANSPSGGDCVNDTGSFTADGNNLDTDGSCNALDPDFATVTPAALNLGALADNGGPTETHALQAGSVAINAGDPLFCEATDQRGVLRDAQCDIGAFEFAAEIQNLIDRVNLLVPPPNSNGLIAKLNAAQAALAEGHIGAACNKMAAFINQVNEFVTLGIIDAETGDVLIADAEAIRTAMGC